MMRPNTGFHANQTGRHVGKPSLHLATRPLLAQHYGAALIEANNVERVLTDIDANYGNCTLGLLEHGALLVFGAPSQLRTLVGQEHGRTIPLPECARKLAKNRR
jgi:hypothetical protein